MPKPARIIQPISIEHRLVTDRHTKTQTQAIASTRIYLATEVLSDSFECIGAILHTHTRLMALCPGLPG